MPRSSNLPQQILTVDETAQFFWGKNDNRLYITKEEKNMTRFSASKD